MRKEKVFISACVYGFPFRYDGKHKKREEILKALSEKYELIPICPEILSGLSIPRNSCSIKENEIVENESGKIRTHFFLKGVERALKIAKFLKIKKAFLKEKSPSCGVSFVHEYLSDGETEVKKGEGIFAEFLKKEEIEVKGID